VNTLLRRDRPGEIGVDANREIVLRAFSSVFLTGSILSAVSLKLCDGYGSRFEPAVHTSSGFRAVHITVHTSSGFPVVHITANSKTQSGAHGSTSFESSSVNLQAQDKVDMS
jgi:hypothetical protein